VLRRAVFLDRDGTICDEAGYLNHISRFRMFPFAAEAIRRLNEAAIPAIVVTNQSGVARGYFPESLVQEVHDLMEQQLARAGAHLTGIYYCPHGATEECTCRKPKTGLLAKAAEEHGLDLKHSFVVGDRYADVELARNAGSRSVIVRTGYGEGELQYHAARWSSAPDYVARDLSDAVDWILDRTR
jgi:D-glycero-D-manno-heptose 1,7-bisphosphate phosphatase